MMEHFKTNNRQTLIYVIHTHTHTHTYIYTCILYKYIHTYIHTYIQYTPVYKIIVLTSQFVTQNCLGCYSKLNLSSTFHTEVIIHLPRKKLRTLYT